MAISLTPAEDEALSALFDMATAKIEEQREEITSLKLENADLRAALAESQQELR